MMTLGYSRAFTWVRWSGGAGAVFVATLVGLVVWPVTTLAKGPGCTEKDIRKAANSYPGIDREKNLQSIEAKLAECKGKLGADEEAVALQEMYSYYMHEPRDYEGCRRVMGRAIQLGEVFGCAQFNENWGYCGGDCSKAPFPQACRDGVKEREIELNAKVGPDIEMEQPVPCNLTKARKLISGLDKAFFHDQALRFIDKYRADCRQAKEPAARSALANDEALVHFHMDDDAACLHALDTVASKEAPDSGAVAFNRALCGGPCALGTSQCAAAAESRKKALEVRAVRAKLRAKTQEHCWHCRPGPCPPWPREEVSRNGSVAVAWDLKTVRFCGLRKCGSKVKLVWVGDLNGDGYGDYIDRSREISRDALNDGRRGNDAKPYAYLSFGIGYGCGAHGKYLTTNALCTDHFSGYLDPNSEASLNGESLPFDQFSLGVTDKPDSTIKSVCVYPVRKLKCTHTKCDEQPTDCADLSSWEKVESAAKSR